MQFRKKAIGFLTLLLLAVAVLCGRVHMQMYPQHLTAQKTIPLLFRMEADGFTQEFVPWYDDQGTYYVFLPSCGSLNKITAVPLESQTVILGGREVRAGTVCDYLELEETYSVIYTQKQETVETGITFLKSGNLPAVYADTRSGDMAYIHSLKGSEESGQIRIFQPDGKQHYSGNLRAIGGRGNATWDREKKSYKLELQQEADLLGMGKAEKWILLSNTFDPSHIRNKTVLDTAGKLNLPFSPESTWVDLYLNGEYAGLYLLCEKNEVHPERVDIDKNTGVLLSIEKEERIWEYGSHMMTDNGIPIRIRYNTKGTQQLQKKLQSAENAILAEDGIDVVSGKHWSELIDTESWARKYLIEEIFGNLDAGGISQFFYWEGDGKVYAGPVWDYDITMGNPNNWQLESPRMLFAGRPHLWNPEDIHWLYALYQKDAFRETVMELYETEFRPALQELLEGKMDAYAQFVADSAVLDQIRWSTDNCLDTVRAMKEYMTRRMDFLDSLWLRQEQFHLVSVYVKEHILACYAMEDGACLAPRTVPYGTETIIYEGWYDGDTDQPYDFSTPITADKLIYMKETNLLYQNSETERFSLRKAITYVPLAVMLMLMAAMLAKDKFQAGKEGRSRYDQSKVSP